MQAFKVKLLKLLAEHDLAGGDNLWWDEELNFYIMCSDLFSIASADCEPIESMEDVNLLNDCILECETAKEYHGVVGFLLYCARKRKSRPIKLMYEYINEALWPLLDDCDSYTS